MNIKSDQLFTNVHPENVLGKIIQFPITRIIIVILFLMPVTLLHLLFETVILPALPESYSVTVVNIEIIVNFVFFLLIYGLYARLIEKRKAYEMTLKGGLKEFGSGFLIGAGLITIMVLLLSVLGYYKIDSYNSNWMVLIDSLLPIGIAAFAEELLFRVIVFKLTEELLGSWIALIVHAVYFGFAHLGNENATIWISLSLVIEAGILLAAAYMFTRRVWLVLGIHMSWNYFQSSVFGIPVSGKSHSGWINPTIGGPEWITGGSFGVEASLIAVALCLAAGLFILKKAIEKNRLVLPIWRRKGMHLA